MTESRPVSCVLTRKEKHFRRERAENAEMRAFGKKLVVSKERSLFKQVFLEFYIIFDLPTFHYFFQLIFRLTSAEKSNQKSVIKKYAKHCCDF